MMSYCPTIFRFWPKDFPKLFINADPGAFLVGYARDFVRTWPNLKDVTVKGSHFIQEDSPNEIGKAISEWLDVVPYENT